MDKCVTSVSNRSPPQKLPCLVRRFRPLALLLFLCAVAPDIGCTAPRSDRETRSQGLSETNLVSLQLQLQRFADDFLARAGQGLDQSAERLGTDAGREDVLRLKLICGSSVLSVVTGPNPSANLLDTVSVTVLMRRSIEDYWMKKTNGAAFQPWLDASRVLETNVWSLAARFLTRAQMDELREGINLWYARTPEIRVAFFARPYAFASLLRNEREEKAEKTSVFNIVNLNPAVREVVHTRLFGERVLFTMQRMPFLLRLQGELLAQDISAQPSVRLALSNSI
jgi:hypothetical protein